MSAHTPGPWHVGFLDGTGGPDEEGGAWIIGVDEEIVVAGGSHDGLKYGVPDEDNAKLIAAAPHLLQAARRAYVFFELMAEKKYKEKKEGNGHGAVEEFLEPEGHLIREAIFAAEGEFP